MDEIELVRKNNTNKKKIIGITLSLALVLMVIGVSYAFFGYYKTGLYTHTINGGKMSVIYDEITGNNIKIDNAYPLSDEEALEEAIEFEFSITGYNESKKNVYYKIEMDYGTEVEGKNRFKDTDMKITLYENDKEVLENEIFENLDNQGIYFGYIKSGTGKDNPIINNYKLRMWINDNVYISNSIEDDTTLWDDDDFNWAYNNLSYNQIREFEEGNATKLSEVGISIYKTNEYGNLYGSFKINVHANLSGDDIGILVYDNNGGVGGLTQSFLTTNMVTMQKPVMEGKGFLGWSSKKDATVPEYYAGDYYAGPAMTLYAVYSDTKNVMGVFPEELYYDYAEDITNVKFINDIQNNIDKKYNNATIKWDLTLDNQGSVKAWLDDGEPVLYIGSSGTTYLTDCSYMFAEFGSLRDIDFSNADTSMVEDMSYMFGTYYHEGGGGSPMNNFENDVKGTFLNSLTRVATGGNYEVGTLFLDLTAFNTSNVKNMKGMFAENSNLLDVNIETFDTSKVEDMSGMFAATNFETLNLSHFDTTNVTDMSAIFNLCSRLIKINIDSFDTSKVVDMSFMFNGCGLENLDLSHFNTSNVENMESMFSYCHNMEKINLSNFNTSKVTNMSSMFCGLYNISSLNLLSFDTSKVENMSYMFKNVEFSEDFNFDFLEVDSVKDMTWMFYYGRGYLNFRGKDLSKVEDMAGFVGEASFTYLRLENCILNPEFYIRDIFSGYSPTSRFENISFSGTKNINNIQFDHRYAAVGYDKLKTIDFSYCTFVGDQYSMKNFIKWADSLEMVDFTGCDFGEITSFYYMFDICDKISKVIFTDAKLNNLTDISDMFVSCRNIDTIEVIDLDTSNVTDMSFMFRECYGVKNIILKGFDTSNVINMSYMLPFASLEYIDISSFTFNPSVNLTGIFSNTGKDLTDGYTMVLVKSEIEQERILNLSSNDRPSYWDAWNVIVKNA